MEFSGMALPLSMWIKIRFELCLGKKQEANVKNMAIPKVSQMVLFITTSFDIYLTVLFNGASPWIRTSSLSPL